MILFKRKRDSARRNQEATSEGVKTGKVRLVAAAAISVGTESEAVAGTSMVEAVAVELRGHQLSGMDKYASRVHFKLIYSSQRYSIYEGRAS